MKTDWSPQSHPERVKSWFFMHRTAAFALFPMHMVSLSNSQYCVTKLQNTFLTRKHPLWNRLAKIRFFHYVLSTFRGRKIVQKRPIKIGLYRCFQSELEADFWCIGELRLLAVQCISLRPATRNIASQRGQTDRSLCRRGVFRYQMTKTCPQNWFSWSHKCCHHFILGTMVKGCSQWIRTTTNSAKKTFERHKRH